MNINQHDYSKIYSNIAPMTAGFAGAIITLHHPNNTILSNFQGVYAAPGTLISIGISSKKIKRLSAPYPDNCTDGDKTASLFNGPYSLESCLLCCYITQLQQHCESVSAPVLAIAKQMSDKSSFNVRTVSNASKQGCFENFDYLYSENRISCHCPVPCEENKYDMRISNAQWPSMNVADDILRSIKGNTNNPNSFAN